MAFKIVIADPKTGKSYKLEEEASALLGKKIGQKVDGSLLKLSGYELEITGGSDKTGNPMRKEVDGPVSRRLLLSGGVGFRPKQRGARKKKRVRGRTISADIVQINMKVVKQGTQKLDKLIQTAPEEEKPAEGEAEKPKEEAPKEEKKAEEKPKEEKKEEPEPKKVEKKEESKGSEGEK